MFEVNCKDTRTTPVTIVNFEQVNDDWVTAAHIPGILNLEAV